MNALNSLPISWLVTCVIVAGVFFGLVIMPLVHAHRHRNRSVTLALPPMFTMEPRHLREVIPLLRRIVTARERTVTLDMCDVDDISGEAYMVLLAQVEKAYSLNRKKRVFVYTSPDTPLLSLDAEVLAGYNRGRCGRAVRRNRVDLILARHLVSELEMIGIREFYLPFYDFLVEVMRNATEHGIGRRKIHWWLLRYHDYSRNCIRYAFVDMGQGIIESYRKAGMLKYGSNEYVRRLPIELLRGLLRSSTRKEGRGGGFPLVRHTVSRGIISDFFLVTNRVSVRYEGGSFLAVGNPNFVGTYLTWTVSEKNYQAWKRKTQ